MMMKQGSPRPLAGGFPYLEMLSIFYLFCDSL